MVCGIECWCGCCVMDHVGEVCTNCDCKEFKLLTFKGGRILNQPHSFTSYLHGIQHLKDFQLRQILALT